MNTMNDRIMQGSKQYVQDIPHNMMSYAMYMEMVNTLGNQAPFTVEEFNELNDKGYSTNEIYDIWRDRCERL